MVNKSLPQFDVVCAKCGYTFKTRLIRKYCTCGHCAQTFRNPYYVDFKQVEQVGLSKF